MPEPPMDQNPWFPFRQELFLLYTDGSVLRLGHTRSSSCGYWVQPRASMSNDGRYVIFDSDWAYETGADSCTRDFAELGQGEVYVIDLLAGQGEITPTATPTSTCACPSETPATPTPTPTVPPGSDLISLAQEQNHGLEGMYNGVMCPADFDKDGKIDLVIGGGFDSVFLPDMSECDTAHEIRLYRNISEPSGEIRFQLQQVLPNASGFCGTYVRVGDFDGNDWPDIAVQFGVPGDDVDAGSTASFMNEGNWSFTKHLVGSGFTNALVMESADVDRDGSDDLIFSQMGWPSGNGLWYRWNTQAGQWEGKQTNFPHDVNYGGTIVAGDLDGDGYPEIAVGGNSSIPFGSHDCSTNLMYGQIHRNLGESGANAGFEMAAMAEVGAYGLRIDRNNPPSCLGMDNCQMLIADVDLDGNNDIIVAGSADGFQGRVDQSGGTHYDFAILRNVDGAGLNYVTWENIAPDLNGESTNSGSGNVNFPNTAVGDLTGDGYPEIFVQGHHRDLAGGNVGSYIFRDYLFLSKDNGTDWEEVPLNIPRPVGEGGQAMADFNNDGQTDLIFCGAEIPWHTNGTNGNDQNTKDTIKIYVFRNTTGRSLDYDVAPTGGDGKINSLDLIKFLMDGMHTQHSLFDFALYWMEGID